MSQADLSSAEPGRSFFTPRSSADLHVVQAKGKLKLLISKSQPRPAIAGVDAEPADKKRKRIPLAELDHLGGYLPPAKRRKRREDAPAPEAPAIPPASVPATTSTASTAPLLHLVSVKNEPQNHGGPRGAQGGEPPKPRRRLLPVKPEPISGSAQDPSRPIWHTFLDTPSESEALAILSWVKPQASSTKKGAKAPQPHTASNCSLTNPSLLPKLHDVPSERQTLGILSLASEPLEYFLGKTRAPHRHLGPAKFAPIKLEGNSVSREEKENRKILPRSSVVAEETYGAQEVAVFRSLVAGNGPDVKVPPYELKPSLLSAHMTRSRKRTQTRRPIHHNAAQVVLPALAKSTHQQDSEEGWSEMGQTQAMSLCLQFFWISVHEDRRVELDQLRLRLAPEGCDFLDRYLFDLRNRGYRFENFPTPGPHVLVRVNHQVKLEYLSNAEVFSEADGRSSRKRDPYTSHTSQTQRNRSGETIDWFFKTLVEQKKVCSTRTERLLSSLFPHEVPKSGQDCLLEFFCRLAYYKDFLRQGVAFEEQGLAALLHEREGLAEHYPGSHFYESFVYRTPMDFVPVITDGHPTRPEAELIDLFGFKYDNPHLVVAGSAIPGAVLGVFSTRPISKDEGTITVLEGPDNFQKSSLWTHWKWQKSHGCSVLRGALYRDGFQVPMNGRGVGSFINASLDPKLINMRFDKDCDRPDQPVRMVAVRDIAVGEELLAKYHHVDL